MSKKQEFKLVNINDANESCVLKSENLKDAALEVLEILGWGICTKELKVKEWANLLEKITNRK